MKIRSETAHLHSYDNYCNSVAYNSLAQERPMIERQLTPGAVNAPDSKNLTMRSIISAIASMFMLGLIWLYRLIFSPLLSGRCRFEPSCSCYAEEAIKKHGPASGAKLALKRLLRCHPWGPFGSDPVP